MKIVGTVINATRENRDLVGKDGVKRTATVSHVIMMSDPDKDGSREVVNARCYTDSGKPIPELPKLGSKWETPPVKKYENYSGVAEVLY